KRDGSLWAWGEGGWGQLGDNSFSDRFSPVQVGTDRDWVAVSAHDHSGALKSDGTLWMWGANRGGQIGNGQPNSVTVPFVAGSSSTNDTWRAVSGGIYYSLGIMSDGTLWS